MNARLRAAHILLAVYAHHVTSESRDVRIYAQVVHFNTSSAHRPYPHAGTYLTPNMLPAHTDAYTIHPPSPCPAATLSMPPLPARHPLGPTATALVLPQLDSARLDYGSRR